MLAQNESQSALPSDEVQVYKNFEVKLQESNKVNVNPKQIDLKAQTITQTYDVQVKNLALEYPAPYIRPIAYKKLNTKSNRNGFLKTSYGTLLNPNVKGQYEKSVANYYSIGIKGSFDRINQKNVNNKIQQHVDAEVYSKYFITKKHIIDLSVSTNQDKLHFFGFNDMNTSEPMSMDQRSHNNYQSTLNYQSSLTDKIKLLSLIHI